MRAYITNSFTDKRGTEPVKRIEGDIVEGSAEFIERLEKKNLAIPLSSSEHYPWDNQEGRELCPLNRPPGEWKRVVACLNIWNDLESIKRTIDTWYDHVDAVIAVDGAYVGAKSDVPWSTDGTLEFLKGLDKVTVVETSEFWQTQYIKRSVYLSMCQEGDLIFVVDADEYVDNAECLRTLPDFDVGWALCQNTLYERDQPISRLYKYRPGLRYDLRHYWVFDGDNLVTNRQRGGIGYDHIQVPIVYRNMGSKAPRSMERKVARGAVKKKQFQIESAVGDELPSGRKSLRILNISSIDPGFVSYRLHSAINTTSPHTSIHCAGKDPEEYAVPVQFHYKNNREVVRLAATGADVIHCHMGYHPFLSLGVDTEAQLVVHHHGSLYRRSHEKYNELDKRAILRLASNYELLQYGDLNYLPNPVPFARYAKLANRTTGPIRVGHSPTKRHFKGTEAFLNAISALQGMGYDVEPVLIERMAHGESLKMKGTCDIFFDSFWLGIQCSGLEAACMGIPVIAGDGVVAGTYKKLQGEVPYTFADSEDELIAVLQKLMNDSEFYDKEAARVQEYVKCNHDYSEVTHRYFDLLDKAIGWKNSHLLANFK
jgi:hypothetical protein